MCVTGVQNVRCHEMNYQVSPSLLLVLIVDTKGRGSSTEIERAIERERERERESEGGGSRFNSTRPNEPNELSQNSPEALMTSSISAPPLAASRII